MAKQNYNKLELTWIGKGEEPKLEPRILIENPEYSYGDPKSENMLIHGDNLLALKALEQDFTGKIKSIYIDPPYNTGNAFTNYDDGIEHSLWLSLINGRIKLLRNLLSEDGIIFISIDDNESHYLKVLCDEVFGRNNFVVNFVYRRRKTQANLTKNFAPVHEHILCYAKDIRYLKVYNLPLKEEYVKKMYKNPDNDPRGQWRLAPLLRPDNSKNREFELTMPNGRIIKGKWSCSEETFQRYIAENLLVVSETGSPNKKIFLNDNPGQIPNSWLDDVSTSEEASNEIAGIFGTNAAFEYAKPEGLIKHLLSISTKPGDLVLDSFLGSGTTASVAHKMGRKWIGIELGEHAKTHCFKRLSAVVDGEQGGISNSLDWQGGGGFKFYNLAPSLLNEDKYGNWIISKEYNAQMLASAMAKQEGFKYEPDEHVYWKQGKSSEKDFIFTTTQFITAELLDKINEDMQPGESVLIACKSYQDGGDNRHANISIKKIPHMLMGRCEFGKDDYSFNIVNMPLDENAENWVEPEVVNEKTSKKSNNNDSIPGLFD
jgi:adenine-specific DNA-methyltransferase